MGETDKEQSNHVIKALDERRPELAEQRQNPACTEFELERKTRESQSRKG